MRPTLLCLVLAACGDDGSSQATPDAPPVAREVVMETKALLVNELAEATLTGGPGDTAVISLDAPSAKLDWNIHAHAGGSTQVIKEELGVMTVRYTFAPATTAPWLLLLRNRDATTLPVTIRIELFGEMQWTTWN
jgi:hypothetical protein